MAPVENDGFKPVTLANDGPIRNLVGVMLPNISQNTVESIIVVTVTRSTGNFGTVQNLENADSTVKSKAEIYGHNEKNRIAETHPVPRPIMEIL